MSSNVTNPSFHFEFPHSSAGVDQCFEKIQETLNATRSLTDLKITVIFKSEKSPEKLFSAEYVRNITASLTFNGLMNAYKNVISDAFTELGYKISSTTNNTGDVTITSDGGKWIGGDQNASIGVRVDLKSLRSLFPDMSDEELLATFGKKG